MRLCSNAACYLTMLRQAWLTAETRQRLQAPTLPSLLTMRLVSDPLPGLPGTAQRLELLTPRQAQCSIPSEQRMRMLSSHMQRPGRLQVQPPMRARRNSQCRPLSSSLHSSVPTVRQAPRSLRRRRGSALAQVRRTCQLRSL